MKKGFIFIAVPLILLFSIVAGKALTSEKVLEIDYIEADHVIDIENMSEVIGFSDYVFVAKVEEEAGTIYRHIRETNSGRKIGEPYTQFKITIISNLKGQLKKNVPITIEQIGGELMDGKYLVLQEGDELLQVGNYYIISVSAGADDRLVMSSPTSNFKLDYQHKSDILSSKEYKDFQTYVKNEVKFDRERMKSKYEE